MSNIEATTENHTGPVMWGDYEVKHYYGYNDLAHWPFCGEQTPWLCCEQDGFQCVVPDWGIVNGQMECVGVGLNFIALIKRYKEVFIDEEEEDGEREMAIACLRQAIAILEEKTPDAQ